MEKDRETFAIIGAAMEVHRELGRGFLELVYQTALALEFQERTIPFKAEVALPVCYKGKLLTCGYRADFVCFENIIVETKAISKFSVPPASSTSGSSSALQKICVNLRNLWTKFTYKI